MGNLSSSQMKKIKDAAKKGAVERKSDTLTGVMDDLDDSNFVDFSGKPSAPLIEEDEYEEEDTYEEEVESEEDEGEEEDIEEAEPEEEDDDTEEEEEEVPKPKPTSKQTKRPKASTSNDKPAKAKASESVPRLSPEQKKQMMAKFLTSLSRSYAFEQAAVMAKAVKPEVYSKLKLEAVMSLEDAISAAREYHGEDVLKMFGGDNDGKKKKKKTKKA